MRSFRKFFSKKKEKEPEKGQPSQTITVERKPLYPHEKPIQEVVVVALDISRRCPTFNKFSALPAEEKIKIVSQAIYHAWQEANVTHPKADLIVITWREAAITNPDEHKSITKGQHAALLDVCRELVSKCDKLFIFAGSSLIRKDISADKLGKIKSIYKTQDKLISMETDKMMSSTFASYRTALLGKENSSGKTRIFTNKSSALFGNSTWDYKKVMPFREEFTDQAIDPEIKGAVFKPGVMITGEDINAVLPITDSINFGLEICREHALALLYYACKDASISVDLLFVLSDSIEFNTRSESFTELTKLAAVYVDSIHPPALVLRHKEVSTDAMAIAFYHYPLFENEPHLVLTEPVYPFQYEFQDCLNKAREKYKEDPMVMDQLTVIEAKVSRLNPNLFPNNGAYLKIGEVFMGMYQDFKHNITDMRVQSNVLDIVRDLHEILLQSAKKNIPSSYDWLVSQTKLDSKPLDAMQYMHHFNFSNSKSEEAEKKEISKPVSEHESSALNIYQQTLQEEGVDTALYLAISMGQMDLVEDALTQGADPYARVNEEAPHNGYELAKALGIDLREVLTPRRAFKD